jgi:hypothetical protein
MHDSKLKYACVAILATGTFYAGLSAAGYELYNKDDAKADLGVDLVGAGFLNSNSWFGESESFLGEDTDNWIEYGVEPRLTFEMPAGTGTLFGQLSGVYTGTSGDDASGLTIGEDETDQASLEQAHVGWRVEDVFAGLADDTLTLTAGNQDYTIGTGLLIADGGGDGGERGDWYIGLRKAFHSAFIASLKSKDMLVEGFYLENYPRSGGTKGDATGGNFEYTMAGAATLGATYLIADARTSGTDKLDVFSGRLDWKFAERLGVSGEYVHETSDQIAADGWYAQISYELADASWAPVLSYRYAQFDGDDPATADNEAFQGLAYGFTDYGTWFQGEITGNYPLANSNLTSHLLRVKAQPREDLTLNALYYNFTLDQPESLGAGVTSDDWGDELDLALDWAASDQLYVIGVLGLLMPGDAAQQWVGGDEDWLYSMLYGSYSW